MGKCICLSRVSTGIQDLDQQTDKLLAAAKSNGYSDDDIIKIEDIESGIKLSEEERNGLTKMKAIINSEPIDRVIVYELSRLGRTPDVLYSVRDFLRKNKVQLQVLNPSFLMLKEDGSFDENSNILFSLFSGLAENEMAIRKARFKRGRAKKAAENKFVGGGCLFGYTYDKEKRFLIDEEKADIVRRVFNEYIEGKKMIDIAKNLVVDGKLDLSLNSAKFFVQRTIHNESYCGIPLQEQRCYYKSKYPRTYPAIISKSLFDEAQKRAESVKRMPKQVSKYVYLCRGLVYTTDNQSFWVNTSSHTYTCVTKFTVEERESINVNITALDSLVWDFVKKHVVNTPKKDKVTEKAEYMSKIQRSKDFLKTLNKRLSSNTESLERLELRIIKGKLDEINGEKIEKSIKEERERIKEDIQATEEGIVAYQKKIKKLDSDSTVFTMEELDNLSIEQKREVVLQNMERIVVSTISKHHRFVSLFPNTANDAIVYDLNSYSKNWTLLYHNNYFMP